MTPGNWARVIVMIAAVLYFPAAILAYTFVPALAPLIPLKQLVVVVVLCGIYVFVAAKSDRATIDEIRSRQRDYREAQAAAADAALGEDQLADVFE